MEVKLGRAVDAAAACTDTAKSCCISIFTVKNRVQEFTAYMERLFLRLQGFKWQASGLKVIRQPFTVTIPRTCLGEGRGVLYL